MLFVMGPRQVGKTTIGLALQDDFDELVYLNWDQEKAQDLIVSGSDQVAAFAGMKQLTASPSVLFFDEIHKYKHWRGFLKGLYDVYPHQAHILVTGSARLDVYSRGGDSLMGRYFTYHVHPFSVGELLHPDREPDRLIREPSRLDSHAWETLLRFGGFPQPLLKGEEVFYRQWSRAKEHQLFGEDLRDLRRVQDIQQLQLLSRLIREHAGQCSSYASFAKKVRVTIPTIRNWIEILSSLYYCYGIYPWANNVPRSLTKEPKYYLWDWSACKDEGKRAENMVASHLLKSVHYWTDAGLGDFGLFYLRDRDKREVDFLVTRDDKPYMLVEVKLSNSSNLSPALHYFQQRLNAPHAFQVVFQAPYVEANCFSQKEPIVVPAKTFLSQLI